MADASKETQQQLERRRVKAERAAAAVQLDQERLAAATKSDLQATRAHRKAKGHLKQARKSLKKLKSRANETGEIKKATRIDRLRAEKDLDGNEKAATKQLAKLAELQAALATEEAADQVHSTSPRDAVKTVAAKTTPAKKATAKKTPAKKAPAKKVAAKKTPAKKATVKKTPASAKRPSPTKRQQS